MFWPSYVLDTFNQRKAYQREANQRKAYQREANQREAKST